MLPGDFLIDPVRPSDRAVVTLGHTDHARPDDGHVLATKETLAIMKTRIGERAGGLMQSLAYSEPIRIGDVAVKLPAGHVLDSEQCSLDGFSPSPNPLPRG